MLFVRTLLLMLRVTAPSDDGGELHWSAPSTCPDQAEMARRIASAGGRGGLSVRAVVAEESPDSWRLELTLDLDGKRDQRTLRGSDCASVADAAVLLIAVQLDAPTEIPDPEPEPEAEPEPEPEADPEPEPATSADPGAPSTSPDRPPPPPLKPVRSKRIAPTGLMLGLAAGVSAGAAPFPGVPLELAIGWSWPRLRVAARGRYHLPRRVDLGESRSALVQLGTAGAEICARPGILRFEFPLCGQVSGGASRSSARGPQTADRGGGWAEAGLDAGVAWSATPVWALTARLGAAAVLAGTSYVRGTMTVFDPAPVVGRFVVGFEAHFGSRSPGGRRRGQ